MIITKDNLLRFIREQRYVTPTIISENFETSTMIASAALSELAKDKLIGITDLKLGSSPYYYDIMQKDCLVELGKKHLSKYEKDVFDRLENEQIINDLSMTIQERLAVDKIKDFAKPLEISFKGQDYKFWVWYLRNLKETREQILEVLKSNLGDDEKDAKPQIKEEPKPKIEENIMPKKVVSQVQTRPEIRKEVSSNVNSVPESSINVESNPFAQVHESQENKEEQFIENYLRKHYLKIENKNKSERGIKYEASIKVNSLNIYIDCFFFSKKPTDSDILSFYTSSLRPKIVFVTNAPKKIFNLSESLDNLTIVNV
ncbi:MAG: hypothetical protein ACOCXG_04800 [Nanoarchaeota archaeon]